MDTEQCTQWMDMEWGKVGWTAGGWHAAEHGAAVATACELPLPSASIRAGGTCAAAQDGV